jgi:WD40 repeat protein
MVMAGSDKKITLWNKEGVLIGTIGEMKDWIWGVSVNPIAKTVFGGCNDGAIQMNSVDFNTVHGLY